MFKNSLLPLATAVALCGASLAVSSASALPIAGSATVPDQVPSIVQNARWVCGPYRCWWRPNFYPPYPYYGGPVYGFYYGRPGWYGRPWGWRRW
jgi:hypothetical protein